MLKFKEIPNKIQAKNYLQFEKHNQLQLEHMCF